MQEQNGKELNIPTVEIRKYAFSPPGPMGWSFQEYEKLLENPDEFLNQQSQFSILLNSLQDTELTELPSHTKPLEQPAPTDSNSQNAESELPLLQKSGEEVNNMENIEWTKDIEEEITLSENDDSTDVDQILSSTELINEEEMLSQEEMFNGEDVSNQEEVEEDANQEEKASEEENLNQGKPRDIFITGKRRKQKAKAKKGSNIVFF